MKRRESSYPPADQLPVYHTIPDPFEFFDPAHDPDGDGVVSSRLEWEARRKEIKELVQRYWLGYRWPTQPEDVIGHSYVSEEPHTVRVGFHFPPYAHGVLVDVRQEFDRLVERLLHEELELHRLIPASHFFGAPTVGEVIDRFGPASDVGEAQQLAIKAWNAGYYIPYEQSGVKYATLRDYTGILESPPERRQMKHLVTIHNRENNRQASFSIQIRTPSSNQILRAWGSPEQQVPAIIDIGGTISGSQMNALNEQGYACIKFTATDIYPDDTYAADGIDRDGVYTRLYPYDKDVYEYASGALMAWSWGASQIISALEQPAQDRLETWGQLLGIDPTKIVVTGHSRYGKSALFAGAFDERIKIVIPSEPGGSGIQSYRYKVEGKIFGFHAYPKADRVHGRCEIPTDSYGGGTSWFPEQAAKFMNRDAQLPFDACHIISLIAPRPFLATGGLDTHWLGNEGAVASIHAAAEVYAYIGQNEIEKTNIAVRFRESNHMLYNRDLAFIIAIMDREFRQTDDQLLHVRDLFPEGDGSLGSMSYPARDYEGINELNSYPFDINSAYLRWSRPDRYILWTEQESFLAGYPISLVAVSDAPDVRLVLPDGEMVLPDEHSAGRYTFRLTTSKTIPGRYELRTIGQDKEERSVYVTALSLSDALRHAPAKGDGGGDTRLIGFASRLVIDEQHPPEVYIGGERTAVNLSPARAVREEVSILEYGILFRDSLFARIANSGWDEQHTFHIKNLKFITIPGYTFEISWGNIRASAADGGKEGAEAFTEPISWPVERYQNGPAGDQWPVIPDTKTEKDILNVGGVVTRPLTPPPREIAFGPKIVNTKTRREGDTVFLTVRFDQPLDTREYGFGLDISDRWETSWSPDGMEAILSIDIDKHLLDIAGTLIIFRLKDLDGHLIPGPITVPIRP